MAYPVFDAGFSHEYPKQKGLVEELLNEQRVLIEHGHDMRDFVPSADYTFPVRRDGNFRYYSLPREARDLTSYVRLLRTEVNASRIGRVLGKRLRQIHSDFDAVPGDTILSRFSVIQTIVSKPQFEGIDLRLLPPYVRIDAPISSVRSIVQYDLERLPHASLKYGATLVDAVAKGLHEK
ncbi:MAG: hypothetical protein M3Q70_03770 [bacterium]|nr:hypothetical protein [bacterium]